ncbi:Hypothetical protein MCYN_0111 [Mycoplasmopsis cynos C142]|uniref:Uncharacterized protein n=1 Tax=Mycoplasmopsis cynos (strain C142) TaxID=1246955 RepID=L0RU84_MYCC1|nr:Hypothetical protein MCYN_0111 [Mycoplasmopsis cynos C142]
MMKKVFYLRLEHFFKIKFNFLTFSINYSIFLPWFCDWLFFISSAYFLNLSLFSFDNLLNESILGIKPERLAVS